MKLLPILQPNRYSPETLLSDGSVSGTAVNLNALSTKADREIRFERLKHPEVRYEVTDHCNASCIMCPRDKHAEGREHGIMDLDQYKKSIDEVVLLGAKKIVLTGFGEPFMDRTLEEKIRYAKSKGLNTYIISNASLINAKRAEGIIEAGLDELRVSFYGMSHDTYDKVMRNLNFDVTMKNLMTLLELRAAKGSKKPRLEISYLMMKENEQDTEKFKEFWGARADAIEIWKPHNFGDGRDYRTRLEDLTVKTTCGRPENGPLQIQWNGEVIPCCYDYNNQVILGNAFEQPVMDVLNNQKYRMLRVAHRDKEFAAFPYCNQCDQLLPHADALVYTNRHNLPKEVAVKMSNTDLYNLVEDQEFNPNHFNERYADGLVEPPPASR